MSLAKKNNEAPADKQADDKKKDAMALLPEEELVSSVETIETNFDLVKNEEDQALKEKLELCLERLGDSDATLRQ